MKESESDKEEHEIYREYPNGIKMVEDNVEEEKLDNEIDDKENVAKKIKKSFKTEYNYEKNYYLFGVCVIGDCYVGKTSLINRFCNNTFVDDYNNTIGADLKVATLNYKNFYDIKLQIWDTAGQEKYNSLCASYMKLSQGFIFVYDISKKESFYNIKNWVKLAHDNKTNNSINILVGNKSDLDGQREVSAEEAKNYANSAGLIFFEASAKDNNNVNELFKYLSYESAHNFLENNNKWNDYSEKHKLNLQKMGEKNKDGESLYYCV